MKWMSKKLAPVTMSKKLAPVTMSKKLALVTMSKKLEFVGEALEVGEDHNQYQSLLGTCAKEVGRLRVLPMKLRWFADEAPVDAAQEVDEDDVGVARDNNQVRPCLGTCAKCFGCLGACAKRVGGLRGGCR